jgi:hypothetical protein
MLPQLRKLEEKYYRELVVIGVHSAKFTGEMETASLLQAILRNELSHPVVNDNHFLMWAKYAIRAWPTLIFIDPRGKIIGKHEGELLYETFDDLLKDMIEVYTESGILDTRPFPKKAGNTYDKALAFPGKLLVDADNSRLFIYDTNHNRILITGLDGQNLQRYRRIFIWFFRRRLHISNLLSSPGISREWRMPLCSGY